MKKIAISLLFLLVSCIAPDRSRAVLEKSGFKNIEITGYQWFACGQDDGFSTGFVAQNANGQYVDGTVCCGLFKSCTVRF